MDEIDWNVNDEIHLLEAMVGHKPIGINKNFEMVVIWSKFIENSNKDISSEKIWSRLETMYNLEALDDMESIPFPNNESEFYLPDVDFGVLKARKEEKTDDRKVAQKGRETPKIIKEIKKDDKSGAKSPKETPRRDSKDSGKDIKTNSSAKKDVRKEADRSKTNKGSRSFSSHSRDDSRNSIKNRHEETPRTVKRPTRGSLKPDDSGSSGKASPINTTPGGTKRRRI